MGEWVLPRQIHLHVPRRKEKSNPWVFEGFLCNTLTKVLTILFSSQMALELSPIYPVVGSNVCVCVCVCVWCGVNDCVRKGMHP